MEQAAMEQAAMKQTAMEQAAMAMRQGQWPIKREARCQLGSDRRALVARLPTLSLAEFPMATDNNSNNASFPLARRCCYGRNARSMADASFAAMAGVTAADHERISKFCLVRLWGWGSRSRSTKREPLGTGRHQPD